MRLCRCYLMIVLTLLTVAASATDTPSPRVEKAWGQLYITHNGRICPMGVVCRYPMADMDNPPLVWPQAQSEEEEQFQDRSLSLLYMYLYEEDYQAAEHLLIKIREYQEKHVEGLPSHFRCGVEHLFHRISYTKPMAIVCLALGLMLVLLVQFYPTRQSSTQAGWPNIVSTITACGLWLFLSCMLAARWYLSGHVPFGGGHETMQVMAWFCLSMAAISAILSLRSQNQRHSELASLGILASGFALLVSNMAAYNPEIDELMPALQSPWLASHVSSIMFSYTLFFLLTLRSIIALCKREQKTDMLMLYAAVAFLCVGIVIGSLWAKTAWGTYWNWDPKETWALITLCIYLVPAIWGSVRKIQRPWILHVYCILAFISVIITYFGVNFVFGGMHSYA